MFPEELEVGSWELGLHMAKGPRGVRRIEDESEKKCLGFFRLGRVVGSQIRQVLLD